MDNTGTVSKINSQPQVISLDWAQSFGDLRAGRFVFGKVKIAFVSYVCVIFITDTRKTKKGYVKNVTLQYFW